MKQFDMIIHAFFLKDGTSGLFVYRNRKITNGFPINVYQFKFNEVDEAIRNVDSMIADKNQLKEIVKISFDFYRTLKDRSKQFGINQKEIKKKYFEKDKVKEKVYFLDIIKITKDNIKANCHFARVVA